ncbi:unnamed protein product [Camellia sinensis]
MMLHTRVRSSSFGGFGFIDMETTTPWLPLPTPIPPCPPPWFPTFLSTDDEQPLIILKFLQHSLATEKWCIWKKPKIGWIKLNTDGSIRGGRNNVRTTSYGGLLRDYNGLPICAYVSSVLPPKDVHNIFVVELWAIWRGLMHAFKLGIKYIWIESDSLSVVKTIKKEQQCFHSTANSGLDHIWRLLNKFDQFEISHSWRESNWAADFLAKMDLGVNDAVLQPVDFPESLIDIINEDACGKLARDDFDPNVPLDESSWSSIWYALSKTLAERTAREFCKDNKIDLRFEALDMPYYKLRSLGFKFKCIEEMFDDCIASLMAQGHLCLA